MARKGTGFSVSEKARNQAMHARQLDDPGCGKNLYTDTAWEHVCVRGTTADTQSTVRGNENRCMKSLEGADPGVSW